MRIRLEGTGGGVKWSREPFRVTRVEYNKMGRSADAQRYQVRYRLARMNDPRGDYTWTPPAGMTVAEMRGELNERGADSTGARAVLLPRLASLMQAELNGDYPEPWAPSGLNKGDKTVNGVVTAGLVTLATQRNLGGANPNALTKRALIDLLRPVMDAELADRNLSEQFYPDQLIKYDRPKGTRAGGANEANTWEQSDREWLIDYLLKPLYFRGTRHWLVKWVGFKRATAVDATELARDVPRVIQLWTMRKAPQNGVQWNDAAQTVTWS